MGSCELLLGRLDRRAAAYRLPLPRPPHSRLLRRDHACRSLLRWGGRKAHRWCNEHAMSTEARAPLACMKEEEKEELGHAWGHAALSVVAISLHCFVQNCTTRFSRSASARAAYQSGPGHESPGLGVYGGSVA